MGVCGPKEKLEVVLTKQGCDYTNIEVDTVKCMVLSTFIDFGDNLSQNDLTSFFNDEHNQNLFMQHKLELGVNAKHQILNNTITTYLD